jgi:subtilase family serine protease
MYLLRRFFAPAVTILLLAGAGLSARAQSAPAVAASARISVPVEPRRTVRLRGHIPSWANAISDLGSLSPSRHLDNLHLILARAPQIQSAFDQLLADQQNPTSPRYHQWLTPQQNAERYGIALVDLAAVTSWLQSQGLSVDNVAAGGVFITFSGPASVVENAFSTSLHSFSHDNAFRYAPTVDPAVPAALTDLIQSVDGLAEEVAHIQSHSALAPADTGGPHPLYNSGLNSHYLSPGDFNKIYDVTSTLNTGISGASGRVANLIDSRIVASDITGFNSVFGLSVAQPNTILLPGSTDPGVKTASEGEAALDVQRILGTAPGVSVDLLVFSSLSFNNIFSVLQYEIGTLNDPIVNMSFGACDAGLGSVSQSASFDTFFKAGAAQGISFFVSSGDSAAADCDNTTATIPATQVLATNLICASSFVTCVGGTEFVETSTAAWSGFNSTTEVSATGYIPEGAWNEPTSTSSGRTIYQASGTGGGLSAFPKPTWQLGAGVPADGVRDVPDVSFTSAYHDGYLVCQADVGNICSSGTFRFIVFGTSASSPSLAGIAALLNEKLGQRQGNLNPVFYRLAATPSNGIFHDVTVATSGVGSCSTAIPSLCNNSTPSSASLIGGLAGYVVGPGYDLATGLGSLDVTNFLAALAGPSGPTLSTALTVRASANPIATAQTVTLTATLSSSSTSPSPTGTVQFYANAVTLGAAIPLSAVNTATLSAQSFPTPGTFAITAVYSGDSNFIASNSGTLSLAVNPVVVPTFTLAGSLSLNFNAGANTGNAETLTFASVNGFAGPIALTCSVSTGTGSNPPVCTLAPNDLTLTAGGTATTVALITTTATRNAGNAQPIGCGASGAVFAMLLCFAPFHRRVIRSLGVFLLLIAGLSAISGCGSGGNAASVVPTTNSYTVTVTGTGIPAGSTIASTASTTFTVRIN